MESCAVRAVTESAAVPLADLMAPIIIEAAQIIAELIELAKQMREGQKRGMNLGLTDDEVAF